MFVGKGEIFSYSRLFSSIRDLDRSNPVPVPIKTVPVPFGTSHDKTLYFSRDTVPFKSKSDRFIIQWCCTVLILYTDWRLQVLLIRSKLVFFAEFRIFLTGSSKEFKKFTREKYFI